MYLVKVSLSVVVVVIVFIMMNREYNERVGWERIC